MYSTVGGIRIVSNSRDPTVCTLVDIFRSIYDEAGYLLCYLHKYDKETVKM